MKFYYLKYFKDCDLSFDSLVDNAKSLFDYVDANHVQDMKKKLFS